MTDTTSSGISATTDPAASVLRLKDHRLIRLASGVILACHPDSPWDFEMYEYDAHGKLAPCSEDKIEQVDAEELCQKIEQLQAAQTENQVEVGRKKASPGQGPDEAHHKHRATALHVNREKTIPDVMKVLQQDREQVSDEALDFLVTLVTDHGLQVLDQGRPLEANAATSALYYAMNDGIDSAEVEIPVPGGYFLKRPFRTCTIRRDSLRYALISLGDVDGLSS